MHKTRALFAFDWHGLSESLLQKIVNESARYDELIFVIDHAEEGLERGDVLSCGELMSILHSIFSTSLDRPFFLFPIMRRGSSLLHYLLRWKILCPEFSSVYVNERWFGETVRRILGVEVEMWEVSGEAVVRTEARSASRGLFITRAQPFHLGHAAMLTQMGREVDEVIVIIAMANRSHQSNDFALAGERMEMIEPWLRENLPDRFYLVPLPYSDFTMENIYELRWLLPAFDVVYSTNPVISAMAISGGYAVRGLVEKVAVSGTGVREAICKGEDFQAMVPVNVYRQLVGNGLVERLKMLHKKEDR